MQLDFSNRQVISYKTRKNIIEPIYGDSYVLQTYYEPGFLHRENTKYRIIGDTENPRRRVSCSSPGQRNSYTATRYRESQTEYDTGDSASTQSEYPFVYFSNCVSQRYRYEYEGDTRVPFSKPRIKQFRVNKDNATGTSRASCSSNNWW